ncbi:divergent PAP2 family protein [Staphylospora marina]|uniref:divergent PAP2 family protein n=1 Tax=Staphylospora marina TaxID=2490858 RepID=UPI000F5BF27C|nr:divergent PAP2 family protein [Staphylospora marina]
MLHQLLVNFPLWTSLTAILLAQILKVLWNFIVTRSWDWNWLLSSGGMPSAHTSAVSSLAVAVGLYRGWDSAAFAVSSVLAIIVMYDATGVRRHAGMQARVLNQLVDDFAALLGELRHIKDFSPRETGTRLKEILGHQPIEVFTGAWFGIAVALVMYWLWG